MNESEKFVQTIYDNFNKRNIDFVISHMTPDVKWANGMDGGFVHGHEGVRDYWIRQFKVVSSNVIPLGINQVNERIIVKVHQVVHDPGGKLLADQVVTHIFTLKDDKIAQFEIGE